VSKTNSAIDTINYFAASVTTGSLAGLTWISTVSEVVKILAGLAAVGMFVITLIKYVNEKKPKKNNEDN
jgi:hypothetical protein